MARFVRGREPAPPCNALGPRNDGMGKKCRKRPERGGVLERLAAWLQDPAQRARRDTDRPLPRPYPYSGGSERQRGNRRERIRLPYRRLENQQSQGRRQRGQSTGHNQPRPGEWQIEMWVRE